jgi:queuosine precursor transporter
MNDSKQEFMAYRYLSLLSMLFVTAFLTATVLSHRMFELCGIEFPGGIFAFPFTFFLGDVITEVYGARRCNQIICISVVCQICFFLMCEFVLNLPTPKDWQENQAFEITLGILPQYCLATVIACLLSYGVNNYVLIKIKNLTSGKYLWFRTIGATAVGEAVYTVIIICIGYGGKLSGFRQLTVILAVYIFKVLYEVLSTPLTYLAVRILKRRERINMFEKYTNINPYTLELQSKDII